MIANIIRAMNGRAPLDENGNAVVNANTAADYGQYFVSLTGDIG